MNYKLFENYLPIKTIAEYVYCPRAAIFMYLNWENDKRNVFLYEGELYHRQFQKTKLKHRRRGKQIRNILVFNHDLEIYGFCDAIEIKNSKLIPLEYKSGIPKLELYKKVQLALQSICLSEMFKTNIDYGFIYFRKLHRRVKVELNDEIKNYAIKVLKEFREKISKASIDLNKFPSCNHKGCSYYFVDHIFKTSPQLISK